MNGLRRIDVSRATGCNLETIRYYEKIGIIPAPPRAPNGYRRYDQSHLDRLKFVLRARELGFSLDEVRSLLKLVDGGAPSCADVRKLARTHLDDIRNRINDLKKIETSLSRTIAQCTGRDIPECAMIDALAGKSVP